jgi:two-component system response regulator AtoC
VPVVAAATAPSVGDAVGCVKAGAVEYLGLGESASRWADVADRVLRESTVGRQLATAQASIHDQYGFLHLLTQSPRMIEVFDQIRAVAGTDATVLVLGETGTGKELVSQAVHQRSRRRERTLVAVNCVAFTETLLESELFGHERGSFTGAVGRREGLFEMADGGTLFLDELGETSLSVQVNLLRVLEEMCFRRVGGREMVHVDVRIVAATNSNLPDQVRAGKFREDLFYRLNVFPIRLPPLRERREDIPLLVRHFLDEFAVQYSLDPPPVSGDAIRAILAYPWPGNVRQLRAMCERWTITRAGQRLEAHHLPADFGGSAPARPVDGAPSVVDLDRPLVDNVADATGRVERVYLQRMLEREHGHLGQTAARAGVSRRTLYTKLREHGLDADEYR